MRYEIVFDPGARREFGKLPQMAQSRLGEVIDRLREEPRPPGSVKMAGADAYRVRAGVYRAVYAVRDEQLIVLVVKVGHRKEVYEDIELIRRRLNG